VCLAHLLRDAAYAIESGDTAFSVPFRRLLLRAIAIGRRREMLKDTTLAQYLYDLDRRLDRIMAAVPLGEPGRKLRKRIAANRVHLFVFITNREVPYQQRIGTTSPAQRDLPQGDQRVPLRVGRGNLRRIPLRRQHRKSKPHFRPRYHSLRAVTANRARGPHKPWVSNYDASRDIKPGCQDHHQRLRAGVDVPTHS
jgi:hypothetical protein